MAKETAEQKLLKIIETTEAQEKAGAPPTAPGSNVAQQVADSVKGTGIPLPPLLSSLLAAFKAQSSGDKSKMQLGLREVNYGLMLVIALVAFFLFMDFLGQMRYASRKIKLEIDSRAGARSDSFLPSMDDFKNYLETLSKRNIFQPIEEKEESKVTEVTDTRAITEKSKDLKLVGISWLDTPESASAMIENTTSGVIYFLKTGEKVNELVVKEIYAESVVLTFQEEELELHL